MITGLYPDQVWVGDRALTQVSDKSRVVPGTFWVDRTSSSDAAPTKGNLYLSASDAFDMSQVRVSASSGNFIRVVADGVRLEGFEIRRHSPMWSQYAVVFTSGVDDSTMRDVAFRSNAAISFKVAGGSTAGGSALDRGLLIDHVTVSDAGWMGSVVLYADDVTLTGSSFDRVNAQQEFWGGPQSGAMKATKTHRMKVLNSSVSNVWGHALWWDQSNFDVTVANNRLVNNSHSSVFFEISHGLTMVNNYILGPAGGPGAEGHSAVRLAGSSGVRLVNNTIMRAPVGVGVYTDPRSKKYDSDGNGSRDRWCSEHSVRYGGGGNSGTDCNVPYTSDFDYARPGAYSPTGAANLTPGMTWSPAIDMMINNVIADQSGVMPDGWTPCGGRTPLCVYAYLGSPVVDVAPNSIFSPGAKLDGNIYQTDGTQIAAVVTRSGSGGALKAKTLTELRSAFAASPFTLSVESNGRSGSGWVNADGTATAQLVAIDGQAAPVPSDAGVNKYTPANSRHYGSTAAVSPTPTPVVSSTPSPVVSPTPSPTSDPRATNAPILTLKATSASDSFQRSTAAGWGAADSGGAWDICEGACRSLYSVSSGAGSAALTAGKGAEALLSEYQSSDTDVSVSLSMDRPATGGGMYAALIGRGSAQSGYLGRLQVRSDGSAVVSVIRTAGSSSTTLGSAGLTAGTVSARTPLRIRMQAVGMAPTSLKLKVWTLGAPEPANWLVQASDNSAGLQAPGAIGVWNYVSSTATDVPVRFFYDDLQAGPQRAHLPEQTPSSAPTTAPSPVRLTVPAATPSSPAAASPSTKPSPSATPSLTTTPKPKGKKRLSKLDVPPTPTAIVVATATLGASKLHVNVNPNMGKGYWKFKVQRRKADGTWKHVKTRRTLGSKETRSLNLPKGRYRVIVLAKYNYAGATSRTVYLKR
ncbi:MAG: right-handed parallel beta-helix repeat-containing protein [Candidatus Nanopelagicales bacterium]